ncbi:MAG TPA: hypothetical protein VF070_42895 [Streptosporangiaceae bacterium]
MRRESRNVGKDDRTVLPTKPPRVAVYACGRSFRETIVDLAFEDLQNRRMPGHEVREVRRMDHQRVYGVQSLCGSRPYADPQCGPLADKFTRASFGESELTTVFLDIDPHPAGRNHCYVICLFAFTHKLGASGKTSPVSERDEVLPGRRI